MRAVELRQAQHVINQSALAVKVMYADTRQRKLPGSRSPVVEGNVYKRLRFAQVSGNGRYVRIVLSDDTVTGALVVTLKYSFS